MRIARHLRQAQAWAYEVTGPGKDPKHAPTLAGAIAIAQDRASHHDSPATFYVREHGDIVMHVERDEHGVVITRAA